MTTTTTTHLPRISAYNRALLACHRYHQRAFYALLGAAWLIALLLIARTFSGAPSARAVAVPTPALPIIIMQATPAPTALPTMAPTPDTRVLEELAALRQQVADLQAAQANQPAPQVVYQVVSAPQVEAAPTVDSVQYQVDSAPALAPQTAAILDRNAWAAQAQEHRGQP